MDRMTRLKQEARDSATQLGHRLGRFQQIVITGEPPAPPTRPAATATCEICGNMVLVDPAATDKEQAITGEGVYRRCGAIEQEGHETA